MSNLRLHLTIVSVFAFCDEGFLQIARSTSRSKWVFVLRCLAKKMSPASLMLTRSRIFFHFSLIVSHRKRIFLLFWRPTCHSTWEVEVSTSSASLKLWLWPLSASFAKVFCFLIIYVVGTISENELQVLYSLVKHLYFAIQRIIKIIFKQWKIT